MTEHSVSEPVAAVLCQTTAVGVYRILLRGPELNTLMSPRFQAPFYWNIEDVSLLSVKEVKMSMKMSLF